MKLLVLLFLIIPIASLFAVLGGGFFTMAVAPFMFVGLLVPLFIGVIAISLVVMVVRRTSSYHEGRRMDMHHLQTDIQELRKELQEVKECLADLTIQLDDQRFR